MYLAQTIVMNDRKFLPVEARRQTLRFGLATAWLLQLALLGWALVALLGRGWTFPAAIVSLIVGWLLLQWLLVVLVFGLKFMLGDWPRAIRGAVPQMLRTLAVEVLWMTRFYLIDQPWRSSAVNVEADDPRPPLLLIHGFLCNAAVWNPLAASLRADRRSFVGVCLEPSYRSFERQLADLDVAVSAWLARTGRTQVTLMGHSMGGVLARAYAEQHPEKCAGVICVAAPHHGTHLGDWFHGLEGGPPSPRCRWLQQFNQRSGERIAVPALNVWSADDNIVLPAVSAQLANTPERTLHGYGHMALVAAPEACALLMQALRDLESGAEYSS